MRMRSFDFSYCYYVVPTYIPIYSKNCTSRWNLSTSLHSPQGKGNWSIDRNSTIHSPHQSPAPLIPLDDALRCRGKKGKTGINIPAITFLVRISLQGCFIDNYISLLIALLLLLQCGDVEQNPGPGPGPGLGPGTVAGPAVDARDDRGARERRDEQGLVNGNRSPKNPKKREAPFR